jgi:hypothetical protein
MQVTREVAALVAAGLLFFGGTAYAHGGGLNAEGCHNNRKTGDYHCHRGSTEASPSAAANAARSARPAAREQQSDRPTCYTGPRGGTYTITRSVKKNYGGC